MTSRPPVFLLTGPTASGKSALALRLAQAWDGEIVNADAIQLYRDLRLLSARPDDAEKARAPHHLFGSVDAAQGWSVGHWLRAAAPLIEQVAARGRTAIVVGGTGLYFAALTKGLAEVPAAPAEQRAAAMERFDRLGEADFRAGLHQVDPQAAARIFPGDRQRLQRAWEVHAATGRSLSDWQARMTAPALAAGTWCGVALEPPRQVLYARCDSRLGAMVRGGVLDEVAALLARGLDPALPAMKAVGLRELAAHLARESSLAEAVAEAARQTRRYAKRQLTWQRNQQADWPRITAAYAQGQWAQMQALAGAGVL